VITNHCGWNPEQNSTYNSPRIINVCEIDRNYLILTNNKRLFTNIIKKKTKRVGDIAEKLP
jgi:hypothetical protein